MDFLLAGKRFSLQGQGRLPGEDVQRRYLWKTFRGKPNSVPGLAEKCSASGRNGVRLRPGMVFGIIPEPCSASARNAVRDQPRIVFALPRNTHIGAPVPAARTHEAIRPAAGGQILLARFLAGKLRLKLGQGLRKWRARHSPTLPLVAC